MRLAVLARHGESEFSVRGLLNGDPSVAVGITGEGREQARALGAALRETPIDLVVTTGFPRTEATADEAMRGREVPRLRLGELGDPRYGPYEGGRLEEYRAWAAGSSSSASPGPGGETRAAIVERYLRGYRWLLGRPEDTILLVAHSLPLAYALQAQAGLEPAARMPFAAYATPYRFTHDELEQVVAVLERWLEAPTF
ncbi:MAG TPA: histidine phosphatase family protein [Gaiellaceae bacterium]|jgi:probable phosphoglycerate mutase|nr:histidine phosphatase family protein [Gaiellaceae bacterium]